MKNISLKSLQKQFSQASAFYGKPDISTDEFFRYYISPFLAKILYGIPCDKNLFSKINNDIGSAEKVIINTDELDLGDLVKTIDNKAKKILHIIYPVLSLLVFLLILYISYSISNEKNLSEIIGYFIVLTLIFGAISFIIINSISQKIAILLTAKLDEYKKLVNYLSSKFLGYKNGLEYWQNLSWQNFEKEVAKRLQGFGYDAINTKLSGDEGVDIVINNQNKKFIIQCKAMQNKIGPSFVRDFVGAMNIQAAQGGMIVSTNGFSKGALETANYSNLHLFSVKDFILLNEVELKNIIGW